MRGSATLLLAASILILFTVQSTAKTFNCSSRATCHALIDYAPRNETSLSQIQALFGVKNLRSLLGANGLALSTSPNRSVPAKQPIRIPFRCLCGDGAGRSNGLPVYTVRKDDDLDHIATEVFGRLVTYEEIAAANGIPDPNKIVVGLRLQIPLPCSCDKVNGSEVMHYGHVVAAGSTVEKIAAEYGVDEPTLLRLNGIADPKDLEAGEVLDVPLKACTSMVGRASSDYPLLVPNGTYLFTAQSCVVCKCDAANNWTLQCEPSKLPPSKNSTWSACPAMRCEGPANLLLGDTAPSSPCSQSCAYAGFNNHTILVSLTNVSTCSGSSPGENHAAATFLRGWSWNRVFICIHSVLLFLLVL